jgi:hypothetical protein
MTRAMYTVSLAALMISASPGFVAASRKEQTPQSVPPQSSTPAQPASAPGAVGRASGPAVSRAEMNEALDILDALETAQADKRVQVSDAQYGQFILRLKKLQVLRRQHVAQRLKLVNQLRQLVNPLPPAQPSADDAAVEAQTKAIDELDRRALQELQAAFASIDEVLNVRQRAKFRLYEETLEQEKLNILMKVVGTPKDAPPPPKVIK